MLRRRQFANFLDLAEELSPQEKIPRPGFGLESVQDYLIKLDIKPFMHVVKISILH